MFDPAEQRDRCENYLSSVLGKPVELLQASRLTKSSREAPWRLDVLEDGENHSYVLQIDEDSLEHEYHVLKAMEATSLPTPRAYGLDAGGEVLGIACFFCDFIDGESLLNPMLAGESWAESLYIDTVIELQKLTHDDLEVSQTDLAVETVEDILESAYAFLKTRSDPLVEASYVKLIENMPVLPPVCFSNGDLWLDNFLVKNDLLVGIIDFQRAGFSDPIFEFLLSFFVSPELKNRGTEERFCQKIGVGPGVLDWYRGLELFDTWHWLLKTGEPFVHHTAESLEIDLNKWLHQGSAA